MKSKITLTRDGRVHIIYGFPTTGKTTAAAKLRMMDCAKTDYATKRPVRILTSDTDDWFGHAKASNQPNKAVLHEIARQMLVYSSEAVIPRDCISVLFTNFNHVEYPDISQVYGFVPASADVVEENLKLREDNWQQLLPRFLTWYDRVMKSPTVDQLLRYDRLTALRAGDYISDHLNLIGMCR